MEITLSRQNFERMIEALGDQEITLQCSDGESLEAMKFLLPASTVLKDILDGDKFCTRIPMAYSSKLVKLWYNFVQYSQIQTSICNIDEHFEDLVHMSNKYNLGDFVVHIAQTAFPFDIDGGICCDITNLSAETIRILVEMLEDNGKYVLADQWRDILVKMVEKDYEKQKEDLEDKWQQALDDGKHAKLRKKIQKQIDEIKESVRNEREDALSSIRMEIMHLKYTMERITDYYLELEEAECEYFEEVALKKVEKQVENEKIKTDKKFSRLMEELEDALQKELAKI